MCVYSQTCATTKEILLIRRELTVQSFQCLSVQLVACLCNGRCNFGLSAQGSNHLSECQALCRSLQETSCCSIRCQVTSHGCRLERFSCTANCLKHSRCRCQITAHSLLECTGHERSLCVIWHQCALSQRIHRGNQQILHTTTSHISLGCRNHFCVELHLAQDVIRHWAFHVQSQRAEHNHPQETNHRILNAFDQCGFGQRTQAIISCDVCHELSNSHSTLALRSSLPHRGNASAWLSLRCTQDIG